MERFTIAEPRSAFCWPTSPTVWRVKSWRRHCGANSPGCLRSDQVAALRRAGALARGRDAIIGSSSMRLRYAMLLAVIPTSSHPSLPASSSASRSLTFAGTLLRSILLYSHWGILSLLAAAFGAPPAGLGGAVMVLSMAERSQQQAA